MPLFVLKQASLVVIHVLVIAYLASRARWKEPLSSSINEVEFNFWWRKDVHCCLFNLTVFQPEGPHLRISLQDACVFTIHSNRLSHPNFGVLRSTPLYCRPCHPRRLLPPLLVVTRLHSRGLGLLVMPMRDRVLARRQQMIKLRTSYSMYAVTLCTLSNSMQIAQATVLLGASADLYSRDRSIPYLISQPASFTSLPLQ